MQTAVSGRLLRDGLHSNACQNDPEGVARGRRNYLAVQPYGGARACLGHRAYSEPLRFI